MNISDTPCQTRLVRQSGINFIGIAGPLLAAAVAFPAVFRELGAERVGVLALAWACLGALTLFDMGLSRATALTVAQAAKQDNSDALRDAVWHSATLAIAFGVVGCIALYCISDLLVKRLLHLPDPLGIDAIRLFRSLACALPFTLLSLVLRGALEGGRRFGRTSALKVISQSAVYLGPMMSAHWTNSLAVAGVAIFWSQLASAALYVGVCLHAYPELAKRPGFSLDSVRRLAGYGGWVALSGAVAPVLVYLDRFLVSGTATTAEAGYYFCTLELVRRAGIIPGSMTITLFPAFAAEGGAVSESTVLYNRALRYVATLILPLALTLLAFGDIILPFMLGGQIPSTLLIAFPLIVVGGCSSAFGNISVSLLHGRGRPDLTAKLYMGEAVLYAVIAPLAVAKWGIVGAAATWSCRTILDALALYGLAAAQQSPLVSGQQIAMLRNLALSLFATALSGYALVHVHNLANRSVIAALLVGAWVTLRRRSSQGRKLRLRLRQGDVNAESVIDAVQG